jgi:hypothetical protein
MLAQLQHPLHPLHAPGGFTYPTPNPQAMPPVSAPRGLWQVIGPADWCVSVPLEVAESDEPVGYASDWARANPALGGDEPRVDFDRMRAAIIGDEDVRRPGDPPAGVCIIHGRWDCRTCWSTR